MKDEIPRRIVWEGNLAVDGSLIGKVGLVTVAEIVPFQGKVALAYVNGIQYAETPVASLKLAMRLAEEKLTDFLLALGARMYLPSEAVLVRALLVAREGTQEELWEAVKRQWNQSYDDAADIAHGIMIELDRIREAVERARETTDAKA